MRLFALHGFLGLASDFRATFDELRKVVKNDPYFLKDNLQMNSVDYFKEPTLQPTHKIQEWAQNFNRFIFNLNIKTEKRVLMGYSQGARLAMQAYMNDPGMWNSLILISGNPGLTTIERKQRIANDEAWAEKFVKGDFQKNIRDWNQQSVFTGSKNEPLRSEKDYDKNLLSLALKNWSVAWQDDFTSYFENPIHSRKIQVIYGRRDIKYKAIYEEIGKKNPRLPLVEIEDAGHRVIFDQPAIMASHIAGFISRKA